MRRNFGILLTIIVFCWPLISKSKDKPFIILGERAKAPVGLIGNKKIIGLCERYEKECNIKQEPAQIEWTWEVYEFLLDLSKEVNQSIHPITDEDLYGAGVVEHWEGAGVLAGDCEEYVLTKRAKLIQKGWPRSALNLAVVWDENRQGHLVLVIRTDKGDFVLDNKTDRVLRWDRVPYEFVKMSSRTQTLKDWFSIKNSR